MAWRQLQAFCLLGKDALNRFKRGILVTSIVAGVCLGIQGIFLFLQNEQSVSTEKMIQALLRQEITINNLFLISRTLNDLHDAGMIRCVTLKQESDPHPYLDLRNRGQCDTSSFTLEGNHALTKFRSLNGETWEIAFRAVNGTFFFISLWLARAAGSLVVILGAAWHFKRADQAEQEIHTQAELNRLASQVSHDIRSPLASLNAIVHHATGLDEATRVQIRDVVSRIRDIANNLLNQNRTTTLSTKSRPLDPQSQLSTEPRSIELVSALTSSLLSEKRMEYRDKTRIEIIDNGLDGKLHFANIQKTELSRVLSNLINNAIEATDREERVEVDLQGTQDQIILTIQDHGKGMSPETLARLGQRGFSEGKEDSPSGSGLGVHHAMRAVESWGGRLRYESELGKGTRAIITLPKEETPVCFASRLTVTIPGTVILLDDDPSVHSAWSARFASVPGLELIHFRSDTEILKWFRQTLGAVDHPIYLCDYELIGSKHNGLEVIQTLGIASEAVLVTSSWNDGTIRSRCEKFGVKLLPKSAVPFIEISVS